MPWPYTHAYPVILHPPSLIKRPAFLAEESLPGSPGATTAIAVRME